MKEKHYNESVEDAALRRKLTILIEDMPEDENTFGGKLFFRDFLDRHGPHATLDFLKAKDVVLKEEEGLDESDFEGHAKASYDRSRMKLLSRRGVFSVMAGGYAGAVFAAHGLMGMGEQVEDMLSEQPVYFKAAKLTIDKNLMSSADFAIGTAIMSESYEAWISGRLKQISEAVWLLNKRVKSDGLDDSIQR